MQVGLRVRQFDFRARQVQLIRQARIEARLDQLRRLAARVERAIQDRHFRIQSAQLPVIAGHLRRQHQQHAVAVGLRRQRLRVGRFDHAFHAAQQVDFIRQRAAHGKVIAADGAVAQGQALRGVGRGARVRDARADVHARALVGARRAALRQRLQQALARRLHAGIILQRALLQAVQGSVAVDAPPLFGQLRGIRCGRAVAENAVVDAGHIRRGGEILAHGAAGGQRHGKGSGQRDFRQYCLHDVYLLVLEGLALAVNDRRHRHREL